ncbi:MAG: response regulator [Rhizobiales bacterium]|nr:response regulator [Hyphomicrobiales bacterium]
MDDLLREFLTETNESLHVIDVELVRFEQDPNNAEILDNIFRLVHTIKGTCGFLGLQRLESLAHSAETLMGQFRAGRTVTGEAVTLILTAIDRIKALLDALEAEQHEPDGADHDVIAALEILSSAAELPAATQMAPSPFETASAAATPKTQEHEEASPAAMRRAEPAANGESERPDRIAGQSIRVSVDTLDHLMTMVSELVLTRNQLLEIARRNPDTEFKQPLQRLSNVTAELQEGVMKTRMQPIGSAWHKLPRIVRDLATDLGRRIHLELSGAETELDRQVLDLIKDPLIHMVRNCAAHGIEAPQERLAAGKLEHGLIRLTAHHQAGHIIIEIIDDGRGLDTDRIRQQVIARGLAVEAEVEKMSEARLHRFIFSPGFTTAPKVTSIAGRGVGMDVARANIDMIGGTIDVRSRCGEGTTFTIKIPLTMAVVSALIVEAGGDRFAIPQLAVVELVRVRAGSEHRIDWLKDTPVLRLRNKLLPLVHLKKLLAIDPNPEIDVESGFIVVIQIGNETFGIVVDGVFQTEEIVVKPMSPNLRHITMLSGNTILGDGSVIMIIDPHGIAQAIGTATVARTPHGAEAADETLAAEEQTTPMLLFRAGSMQQKAVPLSLITRLEVIDARSMEKSNGNHLLQYRGQLMPLVPVNKTVRIRNEGSQPLVVFSDEEQSMGLLVDDIIDIVDDPLAIEVTSDRPGVLGSAVIKGQATEVIDISHFLPLAFGQSYGRAERRSTPRKVLLVDDQAFFRNLLSPIIDAAGYAVTTAASAAQVLDLIRNGERFEVIVADLDMPGMTGFELAQVLRDDPLTAGVPVVGLTPVDSSDMAGCARQFGIRECVAKFDRRGLIAALETSRIAVGQAA